MQLAAVTIGAAPVDLTAGLDPGCYLAQVRDQPDAVGVLYASSETPPDNDGDYFSARAETFFTFVAGDDKPPVWVKSALAGQSFVLALALVT